MLCFMKGEREDVGVEVGFIPFLIRFRELKSCDVCV